MKKPAREIKNRCKSFGHLLRYACLKESGRRALGLFLDFLILPKQRAIEIQTSDAGPGVTPKRK